MQETGPGELALLWRDWIHRLGSPWILEEILERLDLLFIDERKRKVLHQ